MNSTHSQSRAAVPVSVVRRKWAERADGGWWDPERVRSAPAVVTAQPQPAQPAEQTPHPSARDRERSIFARHVLGGESYGAIARDLGISPQRVAQIARRAAERLLARQTAVADR